MFQRVLIASIVAACLCLGPPAFAQGNGNGGGNASENGGGGENGNSNPGDDDSGGRNGNASGNGNGRGNGNNGSGSGGSGSGNAAGNGGGDSSGGVNGSGSGAGQVGPSTGATNPVTDITPIAIPQSGSEQTALGAVQAGQAVPLATIVADIQIRGAGEIIDAQLVRAGGFLLYAVKVLSEAGLVSTEYYYARTGRPVELR